MSEVHVEDRGRDVVFQIDDRSATLTPREAQRFAFDLAGAYMRAGQAERDRYGNLHLPLGAR
jgi:hypothetical protein